MIPADVIFPAFATPYMMALFFPLSIFAVIASEFMVFNLLNRTAPKFRLLNLVTIMNVVSGFIGFIIAAILPSGLVPKIVGTGEYQFQTVQPGPRFGLYAILGFFVAYILSIAIEYWVVRSSTKYIMIPQALKAVFLANTVSYLILILIALFANWFR